MRKYISVLLTLLILSFPISALAASETNPEAEAVLGGMVDKIVTFTNDSFANLIGRKITAADIDINRAYKIYVDANVFKAASNKLQDIKAVLETGKVVWVLPIYANNKTVEVNVAKGLPLRPDVVDKLTEEEIAEIRANEGKWQITAERILDGTFNKYDSVIQSFGSVPKDTLLVSGLQPLSVTVALIPDQSVEVTSLVPTSDDLPNEFASKRTSSASSKVYNYAAVKEMVNSLHVEGTGAGGVGITQTNSISYLTWAICTAIAGVVCVGGYVFAKRTNH